MDRTLASALVACCAVYVAAQALKVILFDLIPELGESSRKKPPGI